MPHFCVVQERRSVRVGNVPATEAIMANVTRDFDLSSSFPKLPRVVGGAGSRFVRLLVLVFLIIFLFASLVSVPTGHVGVLTLFGKVTGETLGEGIHLINPLKSVQ